MSLWPGLLGSLEHVPAAEEASFRLHFRERMRALGPYRRNVSCAHAELCPRWPHATLDAVKKYMLR